MTLSPSEPSVRGQIRSLFELSNGEMQIVRALRDLGPLSRTELAQETGYSRANITSLVTSLLRSEIIVEIGVGQSQGGRRPRLVNLNCRLGYVVGVDLGVTSVDIALADLCANILERRSDASDASLGPERVLSHVNEMIVELLRSSGVPAEMCYAVGVGIPAPVKHPGGSVSAPPLPEWEGFPIREVFQKVLPASEVVVDNDANVMALGELTVRPEAPPSIIFVKIGTGIGAGIISDGKIFRGTSGYAGEMGHFFLVQDGPICPRCGNVGCLEAVAAGPAIARRAQEVAESGRSPYLSRLVKERGERLTARDVSEAADAGDKPSIEIIHTSGRMIGAALAVIVNFLNPGLILIGGGVSQAGPKLLSAIRQEVLRRAHPRSTEELRIEFSRLGPDAGVEGAIALALEHVLHVEAGTG